MLEKRCSSEVRLLNFIGLASAGFKGVVYLGGSMWCVFSSEYRSDHLIVPYPSRDVQSTTDIDVHYCSRLKAIILWRWLSDRLHL